MSHSPLILLAASFSGAAKVCELLGRHPDVVSLSCLDLFVEDSVAALRTTQADNGNGDGLVRALARLHDDAQSDAAMDKARQWLQDHADWETDRLWQHILAHCGDLLVVETSPSTALDSACLKRLIAWSPQANLLHLVRHPATVCEAWRAHETPGCPLWQAGVAGFENDDIWLTPNTAIHAFAQTLPEGQCMRLPVEELFAAPATYLPQIMEWLELATSVEPIEALANTEPPAPASSAPDAARFSSKTLKLAREYGYRFSEGNQSC